MSLVKLLGEQVLTEDLYQLAELMVISLNGYVSPEAETLFRKVLAKDDDNGGADGDDENGDEVEDENGNEDDGDCE